MTLFAPLQPKRLRRIQALLSPLSLRFLRRLALCLASTFGIGSLLAYYAMPAILRSCATGGPRGMAEVALLYLWLRSLTDMWRYTACDLLRLHEIRRSRKAFLIQSFATDTPEI